MHTISVSKALQPFKVSLSREIFKRKPNIDADIPGIISGALRSFIEALLMLIQKPFFIMSVIRDSTNQFIIFYIGKIIWATRSFTVYDLENVTSYNKVYKKKLDFKINFILDITNRRRR
jgi:hypothetical protein